MIDHNYWHFGIPVYKASAFYQFVSTDSDVQGTQTQSQWRVEINKDRFIEIIFFTHNSSLR